MRFTSGPKGPRRFRAYRENDFFYSNDQTGRFNFDTTWTRGPLDNSILAPNTDPSSATFDQVTASTQANYPRRLQLSLKFIF